MSELTTTPADVWVILRDRTNAPAFPDGVYPDKAKADWVANATPERAVVHYVPASRVASLEAQLAAMADERDAFKSAAETQGRHASAMFDEAKRAQAEAHAALSKLAAANARADDAWDYWFCAFVDGLDPLDITDDATFPMDAFCMDVNNEHGKRIGTTVRLGIEKLRADLARVTAERDEAQVQRDAAQSMFGELRDDSVAATKRRDAETNARVAAEWAGDALEAECDELKSDLASAREEAAALRRRVEDFRKALKITASFDHSENCVGRYDENGDVDDEDYQDEHCDCGVGPARLALAAPVPSPVPPATDAVALLRERIEAIPTVIHVMPLDNTGLQECVMRRDVLAALASSDGSRS